ncbi:hypothetical protein ANRL4_01200 [Anaerolineae bacterium]|nr:hypothetical protein ANRL4_01200 [Anaerolineae bacterium]
MTANNSNNDYQMTKLKKRQTEMLRFLAQAWGVTLEEAREYIKDLEAPIIDVYQYELQRHGVMA